MRGQLWKLSRKNQLDKVGIMIKHLERIEDIRKTKQVKKRYNY